MKPRLRRPSSVLRKRSRGQSIVLIALILAVLIGLVALSVDVGHTYAQQRATQRASDAASVDGMTALLAGRDCATVYETIKTSLRSHGIDFVDNPDQQLQPGQRRLVATFILASTDPKNNGTTIPVKSCVGGGDPPSNTRYINVALDGVESTNFATLFGKDSLHVQADAYSKRIICPPVPIGLATDAFTAEGQNGSTYTDSTYKHGKPERRFFLRTTEPEVPGAQISPPGQFVWLSWLKNNVDNSKALAQALMPPGTTNQGYEEAPWDAKNFDKTVPEDYPNQPGVPNELDVMYGARAMKLGQGYAQVGPNGKNGPGGDAELATQLKWLVDNKVKINIPRFHLTNGYIGDEGHYLIESFSSTLIVGYGYLHDGDPTLPGWGKGWYMDMVDLGAPQECPQSENAPVQTDPITLKGSIALRPHYADGVTSRKPVDIVIVLDASGSMNWTWDGRGSYSGQTPSILPYKAAGSNDVDCVGALGLSVGCQSFDAYSNYQDRRLYQAKQVLKNFLTTFNWQPKDRVAVVTYNGDKNTAGGNTHYYPTTGLQPLDDITGKTFAQQIITQAGTANPGSPDPSADLYTTIGASPGAQGLQLAKKLLDKAPNDTERNRSVIFLTDGLLNVFLNGTRNPPPETIEANYNPVTKRLPIDQAISQAGLIKSVQNPKSAAVYVVALGSTFNQSGLTGIASGSDLPFFATVQDKGGLDAVFGYIKKDITNATCKPVDETAEPVVPSSERTLRRDKFTGALSPETQDNGQPDLGVVTVKIGNGVARTVPIATDGTFEIQNLEPNTSVTLSFNDTENYWVNYQGLDKPQPLARLYNNIEENNSTELTVHIRDISLGKIQYVHPDDSQAPVVLRNTDELCPKPTS